MTDKRVFTGSRPSNIALIKYMGKVAGAGNSATNASLSWTMEHFRTHIEMIPIDAEMDRWEALQLPNQPLYQLKEKGQQRYLAHLQTIKKFLAFKGAFLVRSANDFPADCGLASSASSFAALTDVAVQAICTLQGREPLNLASVADLSRQGSGSSCRSFFSPWALWNEERASGLDLPLGDLVHQAVIVSEKEKLVSSSQAHLRVTASALFAGRTERANFRLGQVISALSNQNWPELFSVVWAEFWDMHALFETSNPPFGYMSSGSIAALNFARTQLWEKLGDGPIVTMDAGPNVHFLYRRDQREMALKAQAELLNMGNALQVITGP